MKAFIVLATLASFIQTIHGQAVVTQEDVESCSTQQLLGSAGTVSSNCNSPVLEIFPLSDQVVCTSNCRASLTNFWSSCGRNDIVDALNTFCGATGSVSNEEVSACSAQQPEVNFDSCDLDALASNQFDVQVACAVQCRATLTNFWSSCGRNDIVSTLNTLCGRTGFVSNEQVAACSAQQPAVDFDSCDLNALETNQFDVEAACTLQCRATLTNFWSSCERNDIVSTLDSLCGRIGFIPNEEVAACSAQQPDVNLGSCDLEALEKNQFDTNAACDNGCREALLNFWNTCGRSDVASILNALCPAN